MKRSQLEYFVEIVDCKSMNRASEKLFITQPALSRAIKSLENEIGKCLIERSNHGIEVTSAGKIFYNYARSILNQFKLLEKLKYLDEAELFSSLSISVHEIFLRDDMMLEFYQNMKSVETEIHFVETNAEMVLNNVVQRVSELGITMINNYQLEILQRMADLKDIQVDILGSSPLLVHINEKFTEEEGSCINAQKLLDYDYIHLPKDFFSSLNESIAVEHIQLSDVRRNITISNYHAIINMLNHSKSFIFGHKWQECELAHSHIRSFQLENCGIEKYFIILRRKQEVLSKAAEVFLNILYKNYELI